MVRRVVQWSAIVLLLLTTVFAIPPASAIDEPDRLWLVGERAFADGLYPLARRTLTRFAERYPRDPRLGAALLMLGKARFALGEMEPALEAFRHALAITPPAPHRLETRFWEGETLFRLKRFSEARAAYEEVLRSDMRAPFAPEALYGYGWAELELKRPEPAITAFRDLLETWPEHRVAPSAAYQMARLLVALDRASEALPVLADYETRYPAFSLMPEIHYLLGVARMASGDTRAAVADLRAFIETNPSHERVPEARRHLLQYAVRSGDRAELQAAYATLMRETPPTPEVLGQAFAIASRLERTRDKEAAWKKLRAEFPDHPVAHKAAFELAHDAFRREEWKDAVGYAALATKADEDAVRAEAWLLAGESELKLKRYAPAARAFEAVRQLVTVDPAVRYRALAGLGLAREEQKEYRAALAAYEDVASKSPDAALRDWASQRAEVVKDRMSPPATKPRGKPPAKSKEPS
jgi:TolA-binding protein